MANEQTENTLNINNINLEAVGRVAQFGELYDAVEDKFLATYLFTGNTPKFEVMSVQVPNTPDLHYQTSQSLEEKFNTFKLSGDLQLSLLAGLFKVEGSGEYLTEVKKSNRVAQASLLMNFTTWKENINIISKEHMKMLDKKLLLTKTNATHVVVGIEWGGSVFLSAEDKKFDDKDVKNAEGNMKGKLEKLKGVNFTGSADLKLNDSDVKEMSSFNFRIRGDYIAKEIPKDINEAIEIIRSVPGKMHDDNGKGKPIKYILIPLNNVRDKLKIKSANDYVYQIIDDEESLKKIVRFFDYIKSTEQKLNDIEDDLKEENYGKYISDDKIVEFEVIIQECQDHESELKNLLKSSLIKVRKNEMFVSDMISGLNVINLDFKKKQKNPKKSNFLRALTEEIKFIKQMIENKNYLTIIDKNTSIQAFLSDNYNNSDIYILYFNDGLKDMNEEAMDTFREMLMEKKTNNDIVPILAMIKYELIDGKSTATHKCKINKYRNGKLIEENFKRPQSSINEPLNKKKQITILLLGETGVGKSTFINGFANYLTYDTMLEAQNNDIISLIPTSFTMTDENDEEIRVTLKSDSSDGECLDSGQSGTQYCKTYTFPFGKYDINLIDTPGIGDARGVRQDELNFENILSYIGRYEELHCICILLKPNIKVLTPSFNYCIKQLLSNLEKSASNNIVFMFTNARSTFYKPGDTVGPLKEILNQIRNNKPNVDIAFNSNTKYCLDNESFRFLVALNQGVEFGEDYIGVFSASWEASVKECGRLIEYIIGSRDGQQKGLKPHESRKTVTVNEVKRQILQLAQPLSEITQNIEDNLEAIKLFEGKIKSISHTIDVKKKELNIPLIDLEITPLNNPKTVCASDKCSKTYNVGGLIKRDYRQICHYPCTLTEVPREVLGDPGLLRCWAMSGEYCHHKQCGCHYKQHLHVYYDSRSVEKMVINEEVNSQILTKENEKIETEQKLKQSEQRRNQLIYEREVIIKATAKFAHFFANNCITPYNDAFKAHLELNIENEKKFSNEGVDNLEKLAGLRAALRRHLEEKRILDEAIKNKSESTVTAETVYNCINDLYELKISGPNIRKMLEAQEQARKSEYFNKDSVYKYVPKKPNYVTKAFNRVNQGWTYTTDKVGRAYNYINKAQHD